MPPNPPPNGTPPVPAVETAPTAQTKTPPVSPCDFAKEFIGLLWELRLILGVFVLCFLLSAAAMWLFEAPGACTSGKESSFSSYLYLSAVTFLTIGYGDLAPVTPVGRCLAIFLGFQGIAFTGIVVAGAVRSVTNVTRKGNKRK